jgi:hypothetical protein
MSAFGNLRIGEEIDTLSGIPAFVPEASVALNPSGGKDGFVALREASGIYVVRPKGVLPAHTDGLDENDDDKLPRFVALGKEENIQARVGASRPTYTIPVGIGYPDGSMVPSIVFADAIVEYRPTAGQEGKPSLVVPNRVNAYMKTYASIGLPRARVDAMVKSIADTHKIVVTVDTPKFGTLHNDYYWVNANISASHVPETIIVSKGKGIPVSTLSFMLNVPKSLLGNVCVTMSLKRVIVNETVVRTFGVAFKHIQVVEFTTISSPKLASTVELCIDSGKEASAEVLKVFSDVMAAKPPPTTQPKPQIKD